LFRKRLEDRLAHPPHRVRDELHTLVGIELSYRLEKSLVPDRHQLCEIEPVPLILLHIRDDESQVRGNQPLRGFFVTLLRSTCESTLLGGIVYERQLLDVL